MSQTSESHVVTQSNAEAVREFTVGAGSECPDRPVEMSRKDAKFIIRMVMSELDELACTVTSGPEERDELMNECLQERDHCKHFTYDSSEELIAAQFDALVDAWYYSLNVSARHGVNMSRIFDLVHQANMNKRDPETGKFLRRESDGKIIKPAGWTSPDIGAEIKRQVSDGAWN